jgi:cysteine desulfuration protein SufE
MRREEELTESAGRAGRLERIVAEFAELEPRERLELLLEYARQLPELPPRYQALRDAGLNRVHECQTPVFLWVEVRKGAVQLYAHVADEAPTVKGFVAILADAFCGAAPEEVASVGSDLLVRLGLRDALGMIRMRGLSAILTRVRSDAAKADATPTY